MIFLTICHKRQRLLPPIKCRKTTAKVNIANASQFKTYMPDAPQAWDRKALIIEVFFSSADTEFEWFHSETGYHQDSIIGAMKVFIWLNISFTGAKRPLRALSLLHPHLFLRAVNFFHPCSRWYDWFTFFVHNVRRTWSNVSCVHHAAVYTRQPATGDAAITNHKLI